MSDAQKKKISKSMRGRMNRLKTGKRSKMVKDLGSGRCKTCILAPDCAYRVEEGDSVCPLSEFGALAEALGGGDMYEFENLMAYLYGMLKVNSKRWEWAAKLEQELGVGLDSETSKLAKDIVEMVMKTARLRGWDRPDPAVLIDQRRQQLIQVRVDRLSPEEHKAALQFLAQVQAKDPERAQRLLSAETVEIVMDEEQENEAEF